DREARAWRSSRRALRRRRRRPAAHAARRIRIDERHFSRRLDVLDDGHAVGPRADADLVRIEAPAAADVNRWTAGDVEDGGARNVEHVVERLPRDGDRGRDAGPDAGAPSDVESDVELARAGVEDAARCDAAHRAYGAAQHRVWR